MEYLTLTQVVYSYISATEKPDSSFRRLWDIAFRGYKKLHLHSIGAPKSEELEILSNKTALLPAGFLNELHVYTLDKTGRKLTIPKDTSLAIDRSVDDDRTFQETRDIDSYGNIYRIDRDSGRIIFNYDFNRDNVHIEYLPALQESCDDYIVNPFFEETLISWIRWQDSKDDVKRKSEQGVNRQEFYNDWRLANRSMRKLNPAEMYKYFRINNYRNYCLSQCP